MSNGSQTQDRTAGGGAGGVPPSEEYLRIEQVAAQTGLTKRTLRYYEEIGLLAPPTRTEGGYRLYSRDDIQHLERIKRLRDLLGFSLAQIREIAQAEEEREHVREAWLRETNPQTRLAWLDRVEELARHQMQMISEKLAGLQEMERNLGDRLERYGRLRADLKRQIDEQAPGK
ncbi:MAG TPA: MerR family transcriptional regulator [Ktedonobacterales bacterium]|nr:MerR family transcriptional regulator [Ktedonobacterales bacterium]